LWIEHFIEEKLNPLYRAHYAVWIHWWPLWRSIYTGRNIRRKWSQFNLIEEGQSFLDYGCGTGDFAIPAARIVGRQGKVYALDCFSRQLKIVEKKARKEGLSNIEVILSDNGTGLPDECVDVVWMCDAFHEIRQKRAVLEELHRVVKKEGVLAIYDSLKDKILNYTEGLFSIEIKDGKLFKFVK
jgi:ubiquinone/menaquinone biosynthesis C-methylase UbiE